MYINNEYKYKVIIKCAWSKQYISLLKFFGREGSTCNLRPSDYKGRHLVTSKWVYECIEKCKLLEERYYMPWTAMNLHWFHHRAWKQRRQCVLKSILCMNCKYWSTTDYFYHLIDYSIYFLLYINEMSFVHFDILLRLALI